MLLLRAKKANGINLYGEVCNWLIRFQEVAIEVHYAGQSIHTLSTPCNSPKSLAMTDSHVSQ